MRTMQRPPQEVGEEERPYEGKERRAFAKSMFLSLQGSWLTRRQHSWSIFESKCEEDTAGPVHQYRPLGDGTVKWMTRKEILGS
jgi:hypothetical protein